MHLNLSRLHLRLLRFRLKRNQPNLIYRVWKNRLHFGVVFGILLSAYSAFADTDIPNPIAANSFTELIQTITKALQEIGIPLAVVAIIFAGFKFITAAASGNEKELTNARKMFLWIFIGTAIIVAATVIADAIINFAKG